MKKLIQFCVKHSISVLMIIFGVILCGIISATTIKFDFLPQIGDRHLLITTYFEGIPASEMKKLVTIPIEDASASLKGIKNIESVTRDGQSFITIELHWNSDIDLALSECRQIIDNCYEILPTGCSKPVVKIFNPNQTETFTLAIKNIDSDLSYSRYIADNDIKPRLQRIEGVSTVSITGGLKEEIHVLIDKTKMESSILSLQNISNVIGESNFEYPAGTIVEGNKEYIFKTSGLYENIQEIENTPIINSNEGVIRISDIGEVKYSTADKETFFLYNGEECICASITKKTDASPVEVSKLLKQEIQTLNYLYGNYFLFELINDQSVQLKSAITNLIIAAIIGIIITLIILLIFFKTIKTSMLAASLIPLCIVFSIFILRIFGRSLNVLSLSGIAVGIGMVVDPVIIVIENIHKKFKSKKEIQELIVEAVHEVSLSTIGSSLTTIIVFIPFFFLNGLLGKLFKDIGIAVISSIAFSCILSMTYIPSMYFRLLKKSTRAISYGITIKSLETKYERLLSKLFHKKFLRVLYLAGCFIIGILTITLLKKEMLPVVFSNEILVDVFYPKNTSLQKIQDDAIILYEELSSNSNIDTIYISGGIDSSNFEKLVNPKNRTENLQISIKTPKPEKIKKYLESYISNISEDYSIHSGKDLLSAVLNVDSNTYLIKENDEEILNSMVLRIQDHVNEILPYSYLEENVFKPDRTACSRFNIGAINTAIIAHDTLEGIYATNFFQDGRRIPVKVMFPKQSITTIEQLLETNIIIEQSVIPLSVLGNFIKERNEKILYRNNRKDSKKIIVNNGVDFELPENIISLEKEQLSELFGNTVILLVIVLFLLYFIMGAQFESFLIPLLMLFAIPPAFTGAFTALLIFNQSININSVIALVILFGLAVNNSIILYEVIKELHDRNDKAIIQASSSKLRAILITTLTTICALLPFAIDPLQKNSQSSMSIAIIGGLLLSLISVLFIIPPILEFCMRGKE